MAYSYFGLNVCTLIDPSFTVPILGADGAVSAPTYSFTRAPDAGMHMSGSSLALTVGGASKITLDATQVTFRDDIVASSNNTLDIGLTGTRWRRAYFAGAIDINVATGTAPLVIASTTQVSNLNVTSLVGRTVGTSGNTIPVLNGANTWSATQTISFSGSPTLALADTTSVGNPWRIRDNAGTLQIATSATTFLTIGNSGKLTIGTGGSVQIDTDVSLTAGVDFVGVTSGTGHKFMTGTTQLMSFWNATPIVQPANSVTIDDVLVNTGLRASGGFSTFTATVQPPAGQASANKSPLKFTSGTNLTTAEAGAMEYNGTNLFFTRAGTVRENVLVAIDNVAAPTTSVGVAIVNYYGSAATNFLGDPNRWLSVNILGSTYKIPLYN